MQPQQQSGQTSQWQFVPETNSNGNNDSKAEDGVKSVNWSASEFVAYQKNPGWYFLMMSAIICISIIIFFITSDLISAGATVLIGVLFLVFASRKPRVLKYQISKDGVQIEDKMYSYGALHSFAVIDEGSLHSIMLLPTQRFMPAVSIYFDPAEEQKIVETLGSYLPHEERKQEFIDRLMHKIRF